MLTRFEPEAPPTELPQTWVDEVRKLLSNVYKDQLGNQGLKFEIVARSYEKEIILATSLVDKSNEAAIPVTYISSIENKKEYDSNQIKVCLDTLVDSVGVFFENYFSQPDWNDYITVWQEATFKNSTVYYIVTRENLALMLQADEILRNSLN